jgi:apolipoprotein D and lipocalin family protein
MSVITAILSKSMKSPEGTKRQDSGCLKERCVKIILMCFPLMLLGGCLGYPKTVVPVQGFELERYFGKWYEIARLDHSFERGLENVTAEYSLREGGGVLVRNRGYSTTENRWKEVEGKAFFVQEPDRGYLKVSFFGPFYGSYVVFELDEEGYQYAFVSGPNESYLWFLSRTPTVSEDLLSRFEERARALGFKTEDLILVNHAGPLE